MKDDTIEIIEPTPRPESLRCKALVYTIAGALMLGPYAAGVAIWYRFDWLFGIAGFLIAHIVTGIVRAKLRNGVIPKLQQEYHYSDKAIASWYVDRALLCR